MMDSDAQETNYDSVEEQDLEGGASSPSSTEPELKNQLKVQEVRMKSPPLAKNLRENQNQS